MPEGGRGPAHTAGLVLEGCGALVISWLVLMAIGALKEENDILRRATYQLATVWKPQGLEGSV